MDTIANIDRRCSRPAPDRRTDAPYRRTSVPRPTLWQITLRQRGDSSSPDAESAAGTARSAPLGWPDSNDRVNSSDRVNQPARALPNQPASRAQGCVRHSGTRHRSVRRFGSGRLSAAKAVRSSCCVGVIRGGLPGPIQVLNRASFGPWRVMQTGECTVISPLPHLESVSCDRLPCRWRRGSGVGTDGCALEADLL